VVTKSISNASQKPKYIYIIFILICANFVAYFQTYVNLQYSEYPLSGNDLQNILQLVLKIIDPTALINDYAFSGNQYKYYVSTYQYVIKFIWMINPEAGLDVAAARLFYPISLFFILSCTWFFNRLTKRPYLSFFCALLSTLFIEVAYGTFSYSIGVFVTPRYFHLSIAPLILGMIIIYGNKRIIGPLAFLMAGLSCNFHMGSGFALIVGGIAIVAFGNEDENLITKRNIEHIFLCILFSVIGMMPYLISIFLQIKPSLQPDDSFNALFNQAVFQRMEPYPQNTFSIGYSWVGIKLIICKIYLYAYLPLVVIALILKQNGRQIKAYTLLNSINLISVYICFYSNQNFILFTLLITTATLVYLLDSFFFITGLRRNLRWALAFFQAPIITLGFILGLVFFDTYEFFNIKVQPIIDFGIAIKYLAFVFNLYICLTLADLLYKLDYKKTIARNLCKYFNFYGSILLILITLCLLRFYFTPTNGFNFYKDHANAVLTHEELFKPNNTIRDYEQVIEWIKKNTNKNDLFMALSSAPRGDGTEKHAFGYDLRWRAERSVYVTPKDGYLFFVTDKDKFIKWSQDLAEVNKLIDQKNNKALFTLCETKNISYIVFSLKKYPWLDKGAKLAYKGDFYGILDIKQAGG